MTSIILFVGSGEINIITQYESYLKKIMNEWINV